MRFGLCFKHHQNDSFRSAEEQPSAAVCRYLQRQRTKGKSPLARALDALLLLLILFASVFLYLCSKGLHMKHALLLSAIMGAFFSVLYKLYSAWALQRFLPREIHRLSKDLLKRNMPFIDRELYRNLCQKASKCSDPVIFCLAEPVSADLLLPHLKNNKVGTVFCSFSGFTDAAKKLVSVKDEKIHLIGTEPLLNAAMEEPALRPSVREVYRHIEAEEALRRQRRKSVRSFPQEYGGKRYLVAAGLLLLFSFQTGYMLYYRMLAGLCISVAAVRGILRHAMHTEDSAGHIIS